MNFKGITAGTYIDRRPKNKKDKEICSNCDNYKNFKEKHIDKEKQYNLCKNCNKCYVSKSYRATLTVSRDTTTGKIKRETFIGESEEDALNKALEYKINLDKNGGPRVVTKSNKTLVDLVSSCIGEQFKLKDIKSSTYKRKSDSLSLISKSSIANKPISKLSREDVVNYLSSLVHYSNSTIKQVYELLCMGFGQAKYENIITDNFMDGYKKVKKPKSEYKSKEKKALTIPEERKLVDYLMNIDYKNCPYKYIFLWQLTTGMRIGETLVLTSKDIDLKKNEVFITKTQTKDENGNLIIGDGAKTYSGTRTIKLNNISRKILDGAIEHRIQNKNDFLFCRKNGNMLAEGSINSSLKRLALKLDISTYEDTNKNNNVVKKTEVHTHMLRGTFATRCAEAKIAPIVLKKILGHKDISVTMKYYIDVDSSFIESETDNAIQYLVDKNIFGLDLQDVA